MTRTEATAEIFWTAFKSSPKKEQDAFIARLARDRRLRKELIDISIAIERMKDTTRPLAEVLREIRRSRKR
jgi:hypothetical protein